MEFHGAAAALRHGRPREIPWCKVTCYQKHQFVSSRPLLMSMSQSQRARQVSDINMADKWSAMTLIDDSAPKPVMQVFKRDQARVNHYPSPNCENTLETNPHLVPPSWSNRYGNNKVWKNGDHAQTQMASALQAVVWVGILPEGGTGCTNTLGPNWNRSCTKVWSTRLVFKEDFDCFIA